MILIAATFVILLFILLLYKTNRKKKGINIPFSFCIKTTLIGTLTVLALAAFVSYAIIPPSECTYSLANRIEVIPIGYNESMPPANFIFDDNAYQYIPKYLKDHPSFISIESSRVHINYTDGPAYVEVYEATGFKHALTWVYGDPNTCNNNYYEIYASKDTIQKIQSASSE